VKPRSIHRKFYSTRAVEVAVLTVGQSSMQDTMGLVNKEAEFLIGEESNGDCWIKSKIDVVKIL